MTKYSPSAKTGRAARPDVPGERSTGDAGWTAGGRLVGGLVLYALACGIGHDAGVIG